MSDRIAFLRARHAKNLLKAFRADPRNAAYAGWLTGADGAPLDDEAAADALFERYVAADPTANKVYVQWMMTQAIGDGPRTGFGADTQGGFRSALPAEDLAKATETLGAFTAYKRRLPVEQRDLGQYPSLGAVWKAVEPFVAAAAPVSSRDEDRRERERARAESEIVYEAGDIVVAIPKTEAASRWWGKGTRWCTAADKDNRFSDYNHLGPLVVVVVDGAKFQFHPAGNECADAADDPMDLDTALAAVFGDRLQDLAGEPALRGLFVAVGGLDHLGDLDESTYAAACLDAVERYAMQPDDAVPAFGERVAALAKQPVLAGVLAAGGRGDLLAGLDAEERRAAFIAASERYALHPNRIVGVPAEDLSWVCAAYVRRTGKINALPVTDARVKDAYKAWLRSEIETNPDTIEAVRLRKDAAEWCDAEICVRAVALKPELVRSVPQAFGTRDLWLTAVRTGPDLICNDHERNGDDAFCRAVLENGPHLLWRLHKDWIRDHRDECFEAFQRDATAIKGFPAEWLTDDVVMNALGRRPDLIGEFHERVTAIRPSAILDAIERAAADRRPERDLFLNILRGGPGGEWIYRLKSEHWTTEAAEAAARHVASAKDAYALLYVAGGRLRPETLCGLVAEYALDDPDLLKAFDYYDARKDIASYTAAVVHLFRSGAAGLTDRMLDRLPEGTLTEDVAIEAVTNAPGYYGNVPRALRTEAVALAAVAALATNADADTWPTLGLALHEHPTPAVFKACIEECVSDGGSIGCLGTVFQAAPALQQADLIRRAVDAMPEVLEFVRDDLRTAELAMVAAARLKADGMSVSSVRWMADARVRPLIDRLDAGEPAEDLLAQARSLDADTARIREAATFYVGEVLAAGAMVTQEVDHAAVPTF